MRKSLWVLPFLLVGCNQQDGSQGKPAAAAEKAGSIAALSLTALELTAHTSMEKREAENQKIEQLEAKSSKAMEAYLFDPYSVRFRSLRAGRGGAVCGQYNAKNRLGAYVGFRDFVIGKDGKTVYASRNSDGVETELYTSFADAYVNACATEAEANVYAALTAPYDDYSSDRPMTDAEADAVTEAAEDVADAAEAAGQLEDPFEE